MTPCPCGSTLSYGECCEPLIKGERPAQSAEQLMRSRYSAYVKIETEYLFETTHPAYREGYDHKGTREWAENSRWEGLTICATKGGGHGDDEGEVEFIVSYREKGVRREHHENARFKKENDRWFFTDGKQVASRPIVRSGPKIGRNDPCPCGSGAKFKKCCGS